MVVETPLNSDRIDRATNTVGFRLRDTSRQATRDFEALGHLSYVGRPFGGWFRVGPNLPVGSIR